VTAARVVENETRAGDEQAAAYSASGTALHGIAFAPDRALAPLPAGAPESVRFQNSLARWRQNEGGKA
jgi:hypothetical protein